METIIDNEAVVKKDFSEDLSPYLVTKCPVTLTNLIIGGKWKPVIIHNVSRGIIRFGEMQRAMPGVSKKMLTQELRDLERNGILNRKIFAQIPPRVEYSLTALGQATLPILYSMAMWGLEYAKQLGVENWATETPKST
ncbi:winged helix-turn-helix transcriptional regulator [Larkinella rosea]|uniref:Transcriptional regulator n=1 Tax=Larkinella rosea TaxID=2025312 RepID=A0A3P1BUN7_9BACT|nr:helix-turn-helix domain-containing protein [Larkinella rosea]RRB04825.1 transcriptional regulator [Larkinella rosea]